MGNLQANLEHECCDLCGKRDNSNSMFVVCTAFNAYYKDWVEVICKDCGLDRFGDGDSRLVALDNGVAA